MNLQPPCKIRKKGRLVTNVCPIQDDSFKNYSMQDLIWNMIYNTISVEHLKPRLFYKTNKLDKLTLQRRTCCVL